MADLADVVAAFGHRLHAAGVPVTPERCARFARCVMLAEPTTLTELAWLGRVTLLSSHDQLAVFDRVFAEVFSGYVDPADFRGLDPRPAPPPARPTGTRSPGEVRREERRDGPPGGTSATGSDSPSPTDQADEPSVLAAASARERLAAKAFDACTPEELALIARLAEQLPVVPPLRRARRQRRHPAGEVLDVRATLRRSRRTFGDPVHQVRRRAATRPRRVVLVADVSGSMEPYARVYLHLMRGAVRALGSEAFVFATRLTRLTRPLQATHPDVAYRRAVDAAPDWSGGTRIGHALQTFVDEHGRRGMARGAIVVIVSDGWEVEDPALVAQAMAQLARLARHIIWVNPRRAARDYRPVVGGMAAALPFVDTFVSGHSLDALHDVLTAIARADRPAPAGRPDRADLGAA